MTDASSYYTDPDEDVLKEHIKKVGKTNVSLDFLRDTSTDNFVHPRTIGGQISLFGCGCNKARALWGVMYFCVHNCTSPSNDYYGGPGVQYVQFIARSKALFTARFTGLKLDS